MIVGAGGTLMNMMKHLTGPGQLGKRRINMCSLHRRMEMHLVTSTRLLHGGEGIVGMPGSFDIPRERREEAKYGVLWGHLFEKTK